jgi:hypothetical protein
VPAQIRGCLLTPSSRESLSNAARFASAPTLFVPSQVRHIAANILYDSFCVTCLWQALLYISLYHIDLFALRYPAGWLARELAARHAARRVAAPLGRPRDPPNHEAAAEAAVEAAATVAETVAVQRRGFVPKLEKANGKKRAPGAPAGSSSELPLGRANNAYVAKDPASPLM